MTLGEDYITREELKAYMGLTGSQNDDQVDYAVSSSSEEIEDHCKRQFNDAGAVSARRYSPTDTGLCMVDDFHTATGLIIKTDDDDDGVFETTWAASDYELRPLDGIRNGVTGWPFWQIYAVGGSQFSGHRRASVEVTARWGWAAVPALVKQSAFLLGADTFQLKDSRLGLAGSDQFGQIIRVRDNKMAERKLRHFRRKGVLIA